MSSQETLGASSSRGTTIPVEATTGTGNRIAMEDVDIALGQPTPGRAKFDFLQKIEGREGDYSVHVSALEQRDPLNPSVPDLDSAESKLVKEIVDEFYEAEFQKLENAKAYPCEDDLEDAYTTDDDDSSEVL